MQPSIPTYATDDGRIRVHALRPYLARAGHHALTVHRHRFWQLIVFEQATGAHEVDLQSWPVGPGTVVVLAAGAVHRFAHGDVDGWLVHANPDHLTESRDGAAVLHELFAVAASQPVWTPGPTDWAAFAQVLDALRVELARPDADPVAAQALTLVLFRHVLRAVPAPRPEGPLLRFLVHIESVYREHRPIPEHAAALGLTERALYALTKEALGRTPAQLLLDRRLLEAKRLLAHSDEQVAQIAHQLGYADAGYFARVFRRRVGQSPSAFRKALR